MSLDQPPGPAPTATTPRPGPLRRALRATRRSAPGRLAGRAVTSRAARWLGVLVVALLGGWLGLAVAGHVDAPVGPAQTRLSVAWNDHGDVDVRIPPLGSIELDTHDGPLAVDVAVERLDPDEARAIVDDPTSLDALPGRATADVRSALLRLVVVTLAASTAGAGLLGLLVYRRRRPAIACAGLALTVVAASLGAAGLTLRSDAIREPKYSGLLASAPGIVGSAEDIVGDFGRYSQQLGKLVGNVSQLYATTSTLPVLPEDTTDIRILVVSDIHLNPSAWNVIRSTVQQFSVSLIVDAGDLTDHGSKLENAFARPIGNLGAPYVFIKGNHDSASTAAAVERQHNTKVLTGEPFDLDGLRFLGAGDPRFTPDKETRDDEVGKGEASADDPLVTLGDQLAATARAAVPPVDIAVVHDPVTARRLDGAVPLVIAGHVHERSTEVMEQGTRLFVQGSTGGAGLRGLEGEDPTPIELSVLYVDRETRRLTAWDDISLGGLGLASATVERHVASEEAAAVAPVPAAGPTAGR
ncbi:metallophosphoesterase family protein [Motilibacter aurantiacus]|uniref:metallophosphoesterase family protein n=1 Tax=Motilibacter aurantiacus TaxID=2714955 RepID=UPI0014081E1C|nr:metallophosphoesterase [Motilibacter aurantiacus]NHC47470.1 metallophosphoesterase [Motilibacter aurantiacus]